MNDDEELGFSVEGVVTNGQVILDAPLNMPDGTRVTIRPALADAPSDESEPSPLTADQIRWFLEHTERLRARAVVGRNDPRAA